MCVALSAQYDAEFLMLLYRDARVHLTTHWSSAHWAVYLHQDHRRYLLDVTSSLGDLAASIRIYMRTTYEPSWARCQIRPAVDDDGSDNGVSGYLR